MITSLFILPSAVLILVLLGLAYYLMPKKLRLPQLKKPSPQKNEREVRSVLLKQLQSLNELHTAMATIQVLVTGENDSTSLGLFKKSNKMLYVASARVRAGVDLSRLNENSIQMINSQLHIRIPKAELFDVSLDLEKSFVHDIHTHSLCPASIALHEDTQRKALEEVRREAYASGVIEMAQEQAECIVRQLVELLPGFSMQQVQDSKTMFQSRNYANNDQDASNAEAVILRFPKARFAGSFGR